MTLTPYEHRIQIERSNPNYKNEDDILNAPDLDLNLDEEIDKFIDLDNKMDFSKHIQSPEN